MPTEPPSLGDPASNSYWKQDHPSGRGGSDHPPLTVQVDGGGPGTRRPRPWYYNRHAPLTTQLFVSHHLRPVTGPGVSTRPRTSPSGMLLSSEGIIKCRGS